MAARGQPGTAAAPAAKTFVAYYRVSTAAQGASGLGLDAQREAVRRHLAATAGSLVEEVEEVESGKRNDRPQLARALAACRLRRATLIIAKLDRLARNVAFISSLMEGGVDFVACDNPYATRLTLHILAAVAEHERELISQRTKAALGVVKEAIARDGKWISRRSGREIANLGSPVRSGPGGAFRARRAKSRIADDKAMDLLPYIDAARAAGCTSLRQLAAALNARGIPAPRGGQWGAAQVARSLGRTRTPRG